MGKDAHGLARLLFRSDLANDIEAVRADCAVELNIFFGDLGGTLIGSIRTFCLRQWTQIFAHRIQRPAQVDGGGAGLVEFFPYGIEVSIRGVFRHRDGNAVGGGDADQRRAAYPHVADCIGDIGDGFQCYDTEFMRQPALVDDVNGATVFVQPDRMVVAFSDFHARISFSSRKKRGGRGR